MHPLANHPPDEASPADMPLLDFREAVERVRQQKGAAFAFCPFADETTDRTDADRAGANLYVIAQCPAHELPRGEQSDYYVYYVGGRYGTTSLARETYRPGKVPREARETNYRPLKEFNETLLRNDLQNIHRELEQRALRTPG